jgi:hypothetical protein
MFQRGNLLSGRIVFGKTHKVLIDPSQQSMASDVLSQGLSHELRAGSMLPFSHSLKLPRHSWWQRYGECG